MDKKIDIDFCLKKIDELKITSTASVYIARTNEYMEIVFEYSEEAEDYVILFELEGSEYANDDTYWEQLCSAAKFLAEKYKTRLTEDDVLKWQRENVA